MRLIGHESAAVSQNYTHIDRETKRKALDKLPDLSSDLQFRITPKV
jgi:hypothetical protein